MNRKTEELEEIIGYHFKNKHYLTQALTHSSYANEKKLGKLGSNERLEFLGDAVLELISSDYLYARFTQIPEGELTKKRASLVCEPSLAYCAREFGLPQFLLLGKGEDMTGGRNRDSIVSDATEALLGAIYLDGGFANAKEFVLNFILNDIEHKQLFYDSKTILQEIVQENGTQPVEYILTKEEGPDHNKNFTVEARVNGKVMGQGSGHTKKAAELLAQKLEEKGCPKVTVFDLARDDMAKAVEDAFRYGKLVLATITYNGDIFPFMRTYIENLTERSYQNRTIGLIENGSWAPAAARIMQGMFEKSKNITWLENNVKITSSLSEANEAEIEAMAEELCK